MVLLGRVYSYEEVINGRVPGMPSFERLERILRKKLTASLDVVGAILHGSVLRKDHDERSDMDCVVLVNDGKGKRFIELQQKLTLFAKSMHIDLEFVTVDIRLASTTMHTIENNYGIHLKWAAKNGGVIKRNLLDCLNINPTKTEYVDELKNYIRYKGSRLRRQWSKLPAISESDYYEFLRKILEAPVYIARKIVRWRGIDIFDDSKKRVIELYRENFQDWGAVDLFNQTVAADKAYTKSLLKQISNPDEKEYSRIIERIEEVIPFVIEFIVLNSLAIEKHCHK